jgi:predicted GH43/DUF377 family glycosyl hydrolase
MWKKSDNYIVEPGDWDKWCYYPSVIKDEDVFKMWYTGFDYNYIAIGYATSTDGITWTKYGPPLLGLGGYAASVLKDNDLYKMWYIGCNDVICYAESNDGIQWILYGSVTFISADGGHSFPSVVKDGDSYKMWYGRAGIGYATSDDGRTWNDFGTVLTSTPDTWDSVGINDPNVSYINNIWHMWYQGWDTPNEEKIMIGHAISSDGLTWTKNSNYILPLGAEGEWDSVHVWAPHVIVDGNMIKLWYTGWRDYETGRQIGYATSFDMPL